MRLTGIPASNGIAIGPAYLLRPHAPAYARNTGCDPEHEWSRLTSAIAVVRAALDQTRSHVSATLGRREAEIFDAQALILDDPALLESILDRLRRERINAEAAFHEALMPYLDALQSLDDGYLAARSADLRDVETQVLNALLEDAGAQPLLPDAGVIVVAADLSPSAIARLDPASVLGLCIAQGGAASHVAILARALDLPAVVGLGDGLASIEPGSLLALDGERGLVDIKPDPETLAEYQDRQARHRTRHATALQAAGNLAATADGHRITLLANIASLAEATAVRRFGGEGVGVLRTEFFFLDRASAPTEDEQAAAYTAIAASLEGLPLTIRTLDIGGDKPVPFLSRQREENPFLGLRGIRLCLAMPHLFKTQLRAILRVAASYPLRVLLPMISTVSELQQTQSLLDEALQELERAGVPAVAPALGAMIEVPAAALQAQMLATRTAFFSIGTNDLAQYTLAADRTNPAVASLADPLHPAVLRLIAATVEGAQAAGIPVSLCGELAADPLAAPLLIGLGLEELSMAAPAIPAVKAALYRVTRAESQAIAAEALTCDDAPAVRRLLTARAAPPPDHSP